MSDAPPAPCLSVVVALAKFMVSYEIDARNHVLQRNAYIRRANAPNA